MLQQQQNCDFFLNLEQDIRYLEVFYNKSLISPTKTFDSRKKAP